MTLPPPPAAATAKSDVSTQSRKSTDRPAPESSPAAAAAPQTWTPLPPLKPHRGLFIGLLLAWVAWCGVMVAMYFTTVRPHPQPTQPPPATERATA